MGQSLFSRRGTWIGLAGLILAVASAAWLFARPPAQQADAPRMPVGTVAAPAPAGSVVALGKLLPRARILTIAPPFGGSDARILELPVEEGSRVAAGAVLARLDSEASLQAALAAAAATLASREAALAQTRIITAAARRDAEAALARAEAAIPILRRDYERAAELRTASTDQVRDQRRLQAEQAEQEAARLRASLIRYQVEPERQVDIVLAHRQVEAAAADRDRARADLDRSVIRAPMAGTVLTLYARQGERPGNQGLMSFGALDEMIAEIEVYEDQIGRLALGQVVTLTAQALPRPLQGRIARVGVEVLRQVLTDVSPAANTDSRVIRAVVALDPASAAIAARFVNLQVMARVAL